MSPLPNRPPGEPNEDLHKIEIQQHADAWAAEQKDYMDKLWGRVVGQITFWSLGKALSVDGNGKTVRVQLDPVPGRGGVPTSHVVDAKFGRARWTAAEIVGQRVRVGYDALHSYSFIINIAANE